MKTKTINLHIDRLVLDGLGKLDRRQLSAAIQSELHRLIYTHGIHSSLHKSGTIDQINAKQISLSSQVIERSLGNKIASSIYRGMKQ